MQSHFSSGELAGRIINYMIFVYDEPIERAGTLRLCNDRYAIYFTDNPLTPFCNKAASRSAQSNTNPDEVSTTTRNIAPFAYSALDPPPFTLTLYMHGTKAPDLPLLFSLSGSCVMVPQYVTEFAFVATKITLSGSLSPFGPSGSFVLLAGTHGLEPYRSTGYSQRVEPAQLRKLRPS